MDEQDSLKAAIVAVPFEMVDELECEGLASSVPVFRGAVIEAAITVGTDSAALVTLMQAPESLRAFATWIRRRCARSSDTIDISAKHGDRRMHLTIDGNIDIGLVADFLAAVFEDHNPKP